MRPPAGKPYAGLTERLKQFLRLAQKIHHVRTHIPVDDWRHRELAEAGAIAGELMAEAEGRP